MGYDILDTMASFKISLDSYFIQLLIYSYKKIQLTNKNRFKWDDIRGKSVTALSSFATKKFTTTVMDLRSL